MGVSTLGDGLLSSPLLSYREDCGHSLGVQDNQNGGGVLWLLSAPETCKVYLKAWSAETIVHIAVLR